ncbi:hypothetical protein T09_6940 [Trichinella sp. T9]|nr:hypothetical protein T09_6940 [Trichinella sp. T9]
MSMRVVDLKIFSTNLHQLDVFRFAICLPSTLFLSTQLTRKKKQFAQFCKRVVIEAGGDAIVECQISSHS